VAVFQATPAHRLHRPSELLPLGQPLRLSAHRALMPLNRSTRQPNQSPAGELPSLLIAPSRRPASAQMRIEDSRPRLQSLAPTERPTLARGLFTLARAAALLAFFPPRLPTRPLGRSPPLTHLSQTRVICQTDFSCQVALCLRVSIRPSLAPTPKSGDSPPGVFHLIRTAVESSPSRVATRTTIRYGVR
jgi:hypothetical protein